MHLMPISAGTRPSYAVVSGDSAILASSLGTGVAQSLDDLFAGGDGALAALRAAIAGGAGQRILAASLVPAYPIAGPHKIVCVGLNYAAHAREGGNPIPDYPALFLRTRRSMVEAGRPIIRPRASAKLDYEAELMIVIGKTARHVPEADALGHVFGYTIFNDGSVRDYQRKSTQWTAGKNFDATGAVGPVIVTADALPSGAHGLKIATRLNGATMQSSDTSDMIFSVARIVAILSEFTTLDPGDMIAMGTPSGVGYARTPPVFMKAGDTVEVEIEGIGVLSNPVADEG